ncbi:MAG: type VII secretion protein EccCa [Acidimicrobiia bacterium]|nr:type VII secretion protein EccCa [Acidimicrobiia bacterium]
MYEARNRQQPLRDLAPVMTVAEKSDDLLVFGSPRTEREEDTSTPHATPAASVSYEKEDGERYLHRPARLPVTLAPQTELSLSDPPTDSDPEDQPSVWQSVLPALGSFGIVGFALMSGRMMYLYFAIGMASLMMLSSISVRIVQKRKTRKKEARQGIRYDDYLERIRRDLVIAGAEQRGRAEFLYPDVTGLWDVVCEGTRLWERRLIDEDFLTVRLGTGAMPAATRPVLEITDTPMTEFEPDRLAAAEALVAGHLTVPSMPMTADLKGIGSLGVVAPDGVRRTMARSLISQLAVFRSPMDLRFIVWGDEPKEWEWLKWFPHLRGGGDRPAATIATSTSDLAVLLEQTAVARLNRVDDNSSDGSFSMGSKRVRFPQLVVVIDGYNPADEIDGLDEVIERATEVDVFVICLVDRPTRLPSWLGARLNYGEHGRWTYRPNEGPPLTGINTDEAPMPAVEQIARTLAPFRLRQDAGDVALSDAQGILDLHGIISRSEVDPKVLWSGRPRNDQLSAPVGIAGSKYVSVDIKESAEDGMGPHGLLVGATGSGKSELLRTLVLGLAMKEPPELLSMLLVDFKGGATFAGLENLPHTAGMITNLENDETLIQRMREAMFGELERRQRQLRMYGGFDKISEYQQAALKDPEMEPLPTLTVVIDEFGELMEAEPEFLDLFMSIGRVGRSLGVHLLLCSQKLDSGRATKLLGHLRYRLCLRTFTAEESRSIMGGKDAYELPPVPGLGFLVVDGEKHQFRAALANRPYRETSDVTVADGVTISEFDRGGGAITLPTRDESPDDDDPVTEMDVIIEAIAAEFHRQTRQVWQEPLPRALSMELVEQDKESGKVQAGDEGWLRAKVGVVDRPRTQQVQDLFINFGGTTGHWAVGGSSRTGKSTVLQTLISSMSRSHSPEDVQFYCLDHGGGGLFELVDLPHVGAVFGRGHDEETKRLLGMVERLIERRSEMFRENSIASMEQFHKARKAGKVDDGFGEVFVVIDNWGSLMGEMGYDAKDHILELINGGLHYGIHFVTTANRWADLGSKAREAFGGRLELRLNDPMDSELDRKLAKVIPDDVPGRALAKGGEMCQVALPRLDGSAEITGLPEAVAEVVSTVGDRWTDTQPAEPVRALPTEIYRADLPEYDGDGVVLGIEEHGHSPFTFDLLSGGESHFIALGGVETGKTNLLRTWIEEMTTRYTPDEVRIGLIDNRRSLESSLPESHSVGVAVGPDAISEMVNTFATEMEFRAKAIRDKGWTGPRLVLVIDDHDMVGSGFANPLEPLMESLPMAQELGLHVVVTRRMAGASRAMFQHFLQRLVEVGAPILLMSGQRSEGPVAHGHRPEKLPPGRGRLITRKGETMVQTSIHQDTP